MDLKKTFGYCGSKPSDFDKRLYNKINKAFGDMDDTDQVVDYYKKGGDVKCQPHADGDEIKIKHPGALHREMGIPEDKKIPMYKLEAEKSKAKREGDKKLMKRVVFAENFKGK